MIDAPSTDVGLAILEQVLPAPRTAPQPAVAIAGRLATAILPAQSRTPTRVFPATPREARVDAIMAEALLAPVDRPPTLRPAAGLALVRPVTVTSAARAASTCGFPIHGKPFYARCMLVTGHRHSCLPVPQ